MFIQTPSAYPHSTFSGRTFASHHGLRTLNVGLKAAGSQFVTFPLFDLSTSILNLCDMVQDVRLSAHRSLLRSEAQQVSILLLHLALERSP